MTDLQKLKARKHRIKSSLWIIKACDEGRYPYALCYKDFRKRRLKEIELRDELRKINSLISIDF